MDVKVIDVSKHNGTINFARVKASGIYGVIIRAGYGKSASQKDPRFEEYYFKARAAGLRTGAYWYSYASGPAEAVTEAEVFAGVIRGKQLELPVYYDIEEQSHVKLGKTLCSGMADSFCSYMEKQGYFAGIYSFDSFFGSNLDASVLKKYTCWVARVENVRPTHCKAYDMWQYTWKARIDGINGDADVSHLYRDFESVIKRVGLNGFRKQKTYSVTARISGLTESKAAEIAESCQKLGMNAVTAEE